jgi:hypothetical protein
VVVQDAPDAPDGEPEPNAPARVHAETMNGPTVHVRAEPCGTFPAWRTIYDSAKSAPRAASVTLQAKYLQALAKVALAHRPGKGAQATVTLHVTDDPAKPVYLEIRSGGDVPAVDGVIMPCKVG